MRYCALLALVACVFGCASKEMRERNLEKVWEYDSPKGWTKHKRGSGFVFRGRIGPRPITVAVASIQGRRDVASVTESIVEQYRALEADVTRGGTSELETVMHVTVPWRGKRIWREHRVYKSGSGLVSFAIAALEQDRNQARKLGLHRRLRVVR